jgi:hypothetical protein
MYEFGIELSKQLHAGDVNQKAKLIKWNEFSVKIIGASVKAIHDSASIRYLYKEPNLVYLFIKVFEVK